MTDLAEFLLARIADDEAANDELVRDEVARCRADGMPSLTEDEVRAYWSGQPWWKRRLAECDAKRRIVTEDCGRDFGFGSGEDAEHDRVLRLLAQPYADHPEWREEWKP